MAEAEALHAEHGLSATLVVRGGGPASSFSPLNAWATAAAARGAFRTSSLASGTQRRSRTVLDEVAGRSVPTPTAAAMLIRDLLRGTALRAEQALAALEETMHEHLAAEARRALLRVMAAYEDAVRLCLTHAEQQLLKLGLTIERSLLASIASRSEVVVATEMTAGGVGGNERPPDPTRPPRPSHRGRPGDGDRGRDRPRHAVGGRCTSCPAASFYSSQTASWASGITQKRSQPTESHHQKESHLMNDTLNTPIPFLEALRQIEALTLRIRQERLAAFETVEETYTEVQSLRLVLLARVAALRSVTG